TCAVLPNVRQREEGEGRHNSMAETVFSATESALENQRIGGLQIRVAALCTLIQICDGYDINSVAWAVPSLTHVWNLPGPAFTTAFLWSSIGILVGALAAGLLGSSLRPPGAPPRAGPYRGRARPKAAVAGQRCDLRHRLAAQRLCA